jgi:hypothetical protein
MRAGAPRRRWRSRRSWRRPERFQLLAAAVRDTVRPCVPEAGKPPIGQAAGYDSICSASSGILARARFNS